MASPQADMTSPFNIFVHRTHRLLHHRQIRQPPHLSPAFRPAIERELLEGSADHFSIITVLDAGVYHYRFVVGALCLVLSYNMVCLV
ncbi:hypothetical protein L1987_14823 [Smallanthus sonchifolius]|uniref:Uncharacterized protein n=1 Tax=Smallanthus sonchifolius TaxID=185202 RepID=A0ACB9J6G0_9ASTR|nr:hypothetical protein L1987_14823 [Smallanthus sonchifolius]